MNETEVFVSDISLPEVKERVLVEHPHSLAMIKRLKKLTSP